MALYDFKVVHPNDNVFTNHRIVASGGAATINAGEPTKQGSAGAVAICVDGDGTTSQLFTGIAKTTSTDTSTAAGEVYVITPLPGIVYSGKPKTAGNSNTQAKIDALQGKRVVFDLTGTLWSVDSAAGDATTNGLVIVGGDYQSDILYFIMATNATIFGE